MDIEAFLLVGSLFLKVKVTEIQSFSQSIVVSYYTSHECAAILIFTVNLKLFFDYR